MNSLLQGIFRANECSHIRDILRHRARRLLMGTPLRQDEELEIRLMIDTERKSGIGLILL